MIKSFHILLSAERSGLLNVVFRRKGDTIIQNHQRGHAMAYTIIMALESNTPSRITQYENCDLYTSILFSRKSYNSFSFN